MPGGSAQLAENEQDGEAGEKHASGGQSSTWPCSLDHPATKSW